MSFWCTQCLKVQVYIFVSLLNDLFLDHSNLELTDLPSDIRDLNFAIVYNERGSFSLSKNRLKLFLSSNHFTTIPMDVFALTNLSVLSISE